MKSVDEAEAQARLQQDQTSPHELAPGFYFVAFVDLLGQRVKLSRFSEVAPRTKEELEAFDLAIADTGYVVRNVRSSIMRWLDGSKEISEETLAKIPAERREEFKSIITPATFQSGFSDSFAVAFPLQVPGVEEHLSRARAVFDLWRTLLGLSVMSVESLAQKIPWRAGLDVGIGMQVFPGEVYGPALACAYHLESTVAELPRAVIGRGLLNYIRFVQKLPPTEPLDAFAANVARGCEDFICGSEDGWPMLHILSPAAMKVPTNQRERAGVAADWISKQVVDYWNAKNDKLYSRYARLDRYFKGALAALDNPPSST